MASCHMLTAWLAPFALLLLVRASEPQVTDVLQQLVHPQLTNGRGGDVQASRSLAIPVTISNFGAMAARCCCTGRRRHTQPF